MLKNIKKLLKDEEAPTAVEYALMVAGIALVIIVGAFALGKSANNQFNAAALKVANPQ